MQYLEADSEPFAKGIPWSAESRAGLEGRADSMLACPASPVDSKSLPRLKVFAIYVYPFLVLSTESFEALLGKY